MSKSKRSTKCRRMRRKRGGGGCGCNKSQSQLGGSGFNSGISFQSTDTPSYPYFIISRLIS